MMALESSSFDMNSALAGRLGSPAITAAHSAMFGIIYFFYYMFTYAFSTASTIRCVLQAVPFFRPVTPSISASAQGRESLGLRAAPTGPAQ